MNQAAEIIDIEETGVVAYDEFRLKLAEVEETCNFIPDVSTDEGFEASKRVSLDVGKVLTALEASRKTVKADALAYGRKVDAEASEIRVKLEAYQLPHKSAYQELARMKKEREEKRKARLEERIAIMAALPETLRGSDSATIGAALEDIEKEECDDFYEYSMPALKARNASREALGDMFAEKLKQEKEAAELAELKEKQAIRDQKEREERIAAEAKAKAEEVARKAAEAAKEKHNREVEARKKAELDAAEKIKRERLATQKAEDDAKAAAKQAEIDRIAAKKAAKEAQAKAVREAEEKAEREAEAKEQAERDRIAAETAAREKREANTRHLSKVNRGAAEALSLKTGITNAQAKACIVAIAKREIPAVSISY